jgi:hypothetical protein
MNMAIMTVMMVMTARRRDRWEVMARRMTSI